MHGFDSNWQRMTKQQKEEARALFEGLFGPQTQQESPPVKYEPKDTSKQNFMQGLLFAEGPERAKFEAHQRRLEQEQIDRAVDDGTISPNSPAGQESLRRRAQAQNPQLDYLRQQHAERMRRLGLYQ
jgi:hypothetical protein